MFDSHLIQFFIYIFSLATDFLSSTVPVLLSAGWLRSNATSLLENLRGYMHT